MTVPPCPDPSVLEGFVQGALAREQRAALESHLDGCRPCADTVGELARLFGSASWGPPPPAGPPTFGPPGASQSITPPHLAVTASEGLDAPATDALPPAVTVGRYRLGHRIGAGGMGMVFEAHDPELDRRVAIKLLHPGVTGDADVTRTRLLREARAMARLAHPNVVAVHDVGRVGEQVFLAMELVEGSTLSQWVDAQPRTQRQILEVFVQAGRGLEAAHAVGLVHRDFKPDNVLIGVDGRARVTDFGLARSTVAWTAPPGPAGTGSPTVAGLGTSTHGATAQGALVGTPAYMAPEQWRGASADARTDQFSFCVALFEALFGKRPFPGNTLAAVADNVLEGRMSPLPRSAPGWLRTAIGRGLAGDAQQRHPSMTALLGLLERDRGRTLRVTAIIGAMAVGAAATVGTLAWMTDMTTSTDADAPAMVAAAEGEPVPTAATPDLPAAAPPDPAAACLAASPHARGRWTVKRRATLRNHVREMEDGEFRAARLLDTLDAWVQGWSRAAVATCTPGPHPDARRRCVERQLARFDALLGHIQDLDGFAVQDSVLAAAHRLPAPAQCLDEAWLAVAPAPAPPDQAATASLLSEDLAAAQGLADLEQWISAPKAAKRVAEQAQALGYAPFLAEAQLAAGRMAALRDEPDLAVPWLQQAAATAQGGVHEAVLAQAALVLVEVQGVQRLRPAETERWLRIAGSAADRFGDDELAATRRLAEGRLSHAIGEHLEAIPSLEAALAWSREALGDAHPRIARIHLDLSSVHLALGDLPRARAAAQTAATMLHDTVGSTALDHAAALSALARVGLAAGEHDAAAKLADRAVHIPTIGRSYRHDLERGMARGLLGHIQAAAGSHELALATFEDARVALFADAPKALPSLWQGELLVQIGRHDEGLPKLDAALAELESHFGTDDPRLISSLRRIGVAQWTAGQTASGRATLQRAIDVARDAIGYGPRLAIVQSDLAALERADGRLESALTLLDDAHVPLVGAYGLHHRRIALSVLARADLAWELGQAEYAKRLYGNVLDELERDFGPDDPQTIRARERG